VYTPSSLQTTAGLGGPNKAAIFEGAALPAIFQIAARNRRIEHLRSRFHTATPLAKSFSLREIPELPARNPERLFKLLLASLTALVDRSAGE
jgi:hypothetical protein